MTMMIISQTLSMISFQKSLAENVSTRVRGATGSIPRIGVFISGFPYGSHFDPTIMAMHRKLKDFGQGAPSRFCQSIRTIGMTKHQTDDSLPANCGTAAKLHLRLPSSLARLLYVR